ELALELLKPAGSTEGEGKEAKLFEALLAEAPARPWVDDLIRRGREYPVALLNRYLEAALEAGKLDAVGLVRAEGAELLDLLGGQRVVERVAERFLGAPPPELLTDRVVLDWLDRLRARDDLGEGVRKRLEAVRAVRGFLDRPEFTEESLKSV